MNQQNRHTLYPLAALAMGLAGAGLRELLYRTALDGKGLLQQGHPLEIAVWLLTAAAFVLAFAAGRGVWKKNRTPDMPRGRIFAGAGDILLGVAVFVSVSTGVQDGFPALIPIRKVLSALCMAALIASGFCHIRGKKIPFFCPTLAAVFFLLNALTSYPVWSRDPQLQDYAFTLGAEICLCLFSYYRAALSLGLPGRKQRFVSGVLGIFLCVSAAVGSDPWIHIAGAVHILTTLLTCDEASL